MLLICEKQEDVKVIREETDGKKKYYIEGIFLQSAIKNRNGRMYPEQVMDREVARYTKTLVEQNRAYGELNHPAGPAINLDRVSHIIKELRKDGPNYHGKALVLDTPMGSIAQNIMEGGGVVGVSSRGMGSIKQSKEGIMEVQDDFKLATAADIVADPSAPDAFVRGIMENTQWWYDIAEEIWKPMAAEAVIATVEDVKENLKTLSVKQINERKLQIFEAFVDALSKTKNK